MTSSVDALILAKSLALVEKLRQRVEQIDVTTFPTASSQRARDLLKEVLGCLGDKFFWQPMHPGTLHRVLIQMEEFIERVEASTSNRISWPFVSYCDRFWKILFPDNGEQVFYSVFSGHNYTIESFTRRLRKLLEPVLPPAKIDQLLGEKELCCLCIASLEDENLPLYGLIGHEFGHPMFWHAEMDKNPNPILKFFYQECGPIRDSITNDFVGKPDVVCIRLMQRCGEIIINIAQELFCDLVGLVIVGPTFLISLYELGWGKSPTSWDIRLSLDDSDIEAYPSFAFRLHCLKTFFEKTQLDNKWPHEVGVWLEKNEKLGRLLQDAPNIVYDSQDDRIVVRRDEYGDARLIEEAFQKRRLELKQSLERFLHLCFETVIQPLQSEPELAPISCNHVGELLRRLDEDIIPNVIPDKAHPYLGAPASFRTILYASALYRMHLLSCPDGTGFTMEMRNNKIKKIERLTAKALEVSYIQREFNLWEGRNQK